MFTKKWEIVNAENMRHPRKVAYDTSQIRKIAILKLIACRCGTTINEHLLLICIIAKSMVQNERL